MREIRRRTRVVERSPTASHASLAAARLRYIVGTAWSTKCYMNMRPLSAATHANRSRRLIKCAKDSDTTKCGH
jgi:type IV pilus biogenesis protein CpaD/CtpE